MDLKGFLKEKKWKKMKKDQWLILCLTGILLLVVAMPTGKKNSDTKKEDNTQRITETANAAGTGQSEYERMLEQRLTAILQGMEGVGEVQVMLTFQDEGEVIVEKDDTMREEKDIGQMGGSDTASERTGNTSRESSETTVFAQTDAGETPFVNRTLLPKIDGVLIVAEGGGNSGVRKNISEAVEALFGLDAHKIKIVKMKTKGESK